VFVIWRNDLGSRSEVRPSLLGEVDEAYTDKVSRVMVPFDGWLGHECTVVPDLECLNSGLDTVNPQTPFWGER